MKHTIIKYAFLALVISSLSAPQAGAQNHWYVDAARGSDTNPGTLSKPFKSITKAFSVCGAKAVIHVFPGVYGTTTTGEKFPIKFTGNHQNVKLLGLAAKACIVDMGSKATLAFRLLQGSKDVEIAGLTIRNSKFPKPGWYDMAVGVGQYNGYGNQNVNIHHCIFRKVNRGIFTWGDTSNDVLIHDNLFLDTMNDCLNVHGKGKVFIYNNVMAGSTAGMAVSLQSANATVANNIAYKCNRGITNNATVPTNKIEGNCGYGCTKYNFHHHPKAPPFSKSNIQADPLFLNPAQGDFHLKPGSPCIETGYHKALPGMVNDFFGDARVADFNDDGLAVPDMGVHEVNEVRLILQSGWALGGKPVFKVDGPASKAYLGVFFLAHRPASYVLDPLGAFCLDPTSILMASTTPIPGNVTFQVPNDPLLSGARIYVQALGARNKAGTVLARTTGRLDLML